MEIETSCKMARVVQFSEGEFCRSCWASIGNLVVIALKRNIIRKGKAANKHLLCNKAFLDVFFCAERRASNSIIISKQCRGNSRILRKFTRDLEVQFHVDVYMDAQHKQKWK